MDPALEGPWIILDTVTEAYVRLDNDFASRSSIERLCRFSERCHPNCWVRNCGTYIHPVPARLWT